MRARPRIGRLRPTDPSQLGPYDLVGHLGCTALGETYLARPVPDGRSPQRGLVAMTAVHPHHAVDDTFRDAFAETTATLLGLPVPATAPVVDRDCVAGLPWVAVAYVAAPSLAAVLEQDGPLDGSTTGVLGLRLAEALRALHDRGLVHHGLRPSTVLLATDGPYLADPGVERVAAATKHTTITLRPGPPDFLAPEQALGEPAGPAADVFALAAGLVAASTGAGPFGTGRPLDVLRRVVDDHPDLAGVPGDLAHVLQPCLVRQPECRPTISEMHALLGPWQDLWLPDE